MHKRLDMLDDMFLLVLSCLVARRIAPSMSTLTQDEWLKLAAAKLLAFAVASQIHTVGTKSALAIRFVHRRIRKDQVVLSGLRVSLSLFHF